MLALTSLGIGHTAISLIALGAGIVAFIRDKEITSRNFVGKLYIWTTVFTCLSGFPIMQHGGFGKLHVLGVLTLVTLVVAALAGKGKMVWPGRALCESGELLGYVSVPLDSRPRRDDHAAAGFWRPADQRPRRPRVAGGHRSFVPPVSHPREFANSPPAQKQ